MIPFNSDGFLIKIFEICDVVISNIYRFLVYSPRYTSCATLSASQRGWVGEAKTG